MKNPIRQARPVRLALAAAMLAAIPSIAVAQAPNAITLETATRAVDAAEAEARANDWNVTIVVTDADGVPIHLRRLDGASPRSFDIALGKARTVAATGLATLEYGRQVAAGTREAIEGGITFDGGLPIRLGGEVAGAIAVSGVRADQDAQIARAGLAAISAE